MDVRPLSREAAPTETNCNQLVVDHGGVKSVLWYFLGCGSARSTLLSKRWSYNFITKLKLYDLNHEV